VIVFVISRSLAPNFVTFHSCKFPVYVPCRERNGAVGPQVKKRGYVDCSAAPTELPSGRYGLSQFFGMGVITYAHEKSHLDPVYIPLVRRARHFTRKIMPYAVINGSFDVIKSLALNIDPQFTEEQVSLVVTGAFTVMGPGGPRRHTPGSAEVGPHAGSHLRHGNRPCHAEKYSRMQYEDGYCEDRRRGAMKHGSTPEDRYEDRYWSGVEKKTKYRERRGS